MSIVIPGKWPKESVSARPPVGANVQMVGPNDAGVYTGGGEYGGLRCAAPVQVYLDLLQLPERASEAAQHLRAYYLRWFI